MTKMNQHIKTFDHTYYFSVATGERNKLREKARDVFNHPNKLSDSFIGFDSLVSQNIKFRNKTERLRRRDPKDHMTFFQWICGESKIAFSSMNINQKTHFDNHSSKDFNIDYLGNLKNSEKNNLMSKDFAMRDWIDDTDQMVPRACIEFPRMSDGYTSFKSHQERPWGGTSAPIYCDPFLDENLMRLNSN